MVAMEELEVKEKELKQALELADSLDERKALRIELREIRRQLFETPKISMKEQNNNSIIVTSKTTVTTKVETKIKTDSNNNSMTLNSQGSIESVSTNGNAADRAVRRARRAQHMKNLSEESMPAAAVITQKKTEDKPEVSPPKKQISVEITDTSVKTSSTNNMNKISIGIKTESKISSTTITTNSTTKPSFNASSSPGLRRTATWSPKDRVNSSTTNKVNQFTANKTKFGAQAGQSPFSFGTSYLKKNTDNTVVNENESEPVRRTFSLNKYTPTKTPVSYKLANNGIPKSSTIFEQNKEQFNNSPTSQSTGTARIHSSSEATLNFGSINRHTKVNFNNTIVKPSEEKQQQQSPQQSPQRSPAQRKASISKYITPINNMKGMNKDNEETKVNNDVGLNFSQINNGNNNSGLNNRSLDRTTSAPPARSPMVNRFALRNTLSNSIRDAANKQNNTQETPSTVDKSTNRLSLQAEKSINGLSSNRDKSPNRLSLRDKSPTPNRLSLREKSPSRFDANRDKSPNRFSSQDKSSNRLGPQKPQERPKSVGPETIFSGVSNNANDRMAMFREAAEKEKRDKERQEERKRNAEEFAAKAAAESKRKAEEKAKQEAEEKIRKEKEEKEEPKEEMKDSERMKYAAPCMKKREKKKVVRRTMSISSIVLDWVQEMIKDYAVEVRNFSSSWNDGMAFCALIHHFNPDEFDFSELKAENKRHNFDLAFETGLKCKNIPILLDTEDMVRMAKPEPRSVQCYIQWVWSVYGPTSGYGPTPQEVQSASVS